MIFDTNAFIAWMRNDTELVRSLRGLSVPVITLISVGELYYGVSNSRKVEENRSILENALRDVQVLEPNRQTAILYGQIRGLCKRNGQTIPSNDIWIAAMAIENDMYLLTRDSHFEVIQELRLRNW